MTPEDRLDMTEVVTMQNFSSKDISDRRQADMRMGSDIDPLPR